MAAAGVPEEIIDSECIRELYGISLHVTTIEGKKICADGVIRKSCPDLQRTGQETPGRTERK